MYAFNTVALVALAGVAAAKTAVVSPAPHPTMATIVKNGTVTVTSVYDVYTTYCPGPTSFHLGGKDYVVTEPCTLTITDCPCTVTETHPAGPTWIPQHPGSPGKPYNPVHPKPENPEHPSKPGHPGKPEQPETPSKPQQPEQPQQPGKPTTPETPKTSKPAKGEEVPETPVVTAGAGAVQLGLGLAAIFGLMAL
ncbi:hypothetical protein F53441_6038 [Fusarium austroafricanum]|uniref:Sporozoite surface protein 2 n=1 Tax=Fusarium austroafricanum TaxID=2364996 RepID=A0A8H4NTS9_9HYPO|nr:hypothetical protein F53441_6038 [Fusarium austroafricanum]